MATETMHRRDDHATSVAAAKRIESRLSELQSAVFSALCSVEDATDKELEQMPRFSTYGPSTVRKRRGELARKGLVEETGERRGGLKVWRVVPPPPKQGLLF